MPPLPNVPATLKVATIWGDGINLDIVSRFYIRYAGSAPSSTNLNAFASDVSGYLTTHFIPFVNEAYSLLDVHCTDLSSASGAEGGDNTAVPGIGTDPPLPSDVAFVTSYEISRRYRGGHPRGYWPLGQAPDLANPQTWDPTFRSAVQTNVEQLFTSIITSPWSGGGPLEHVNVSYFHGFTVVTNPTTGRARNVPTVRGTPVVDVISGYIARGHIGTQRRRLQY